MKSKEILMKVKEAIIKLKKQNKSIRKIAKTVGVARSTVGYILKGQSHCTFCSIDVHSYACECARPATQAHAKSFAFLCIAKFKLDEL